MNAFLLTGGLLTIALGAAHSLLGERLLLGPMFEGGPLPRLLGSRTFARQTLRFTWHLTSLLALGIGLWLVALAFRALEPQTVWTLRLLALLFVACSLVSLVGARGKHFSWFVFLAIAAVTWLGAA